MILKGKTALVTGGAKRLGKAVALSLSKAGANVMIHYGTSRDDAEATVEAIRATGVSGWCIQSDLSDPTATEALFAHAQEMAGPFHILVNNASIFPEKGFGDFTADDLTANISVNALAPAILARRFAAQSQEEGQIINFLDCRIVDYDERHVPYHLSKRMLFTLTRIMALEFAPAIQVNAVAPGLILPPEGKDIAYLERLAHTNPLQRYGEEEDIVDAVLFLLKSSFITGQVLFIDGGRHIKGAMYG